MSFLAAVLLPTPAHAEATCTRDAPSRTLFVTITEPGTALVISQGGTSIEVRTFSGTVIPCPGPPTMSNTDRVIAKDVSSGNAFLMILRPHRFVPGFTDEGDGTSEIEFEIDLGEGSDDVFSLAAGEFGVAGIRFGFGSAGINVNGDGDVDLAIAGVERTESTGTDLDDEIRADGSFATGGSYQIPLRAYGNTGDDILLGGLRRDVLVGQGDDDVISGASGDDDLDGGGGLDRLLGVRGDDVLNGGDDPDILRGGDARDELVGARGNDELFGNDGQDELRGDEGNDLLDGGPANDQCTGGPGTDRLRRCERIR